MDCAFVRARLHLCAPFQCSTAPVWCNSAIHTLRMGNGGAGTGRQTGDWHHTAVLAGPAVHAAGYQFAFVQVGLNSALMVFAALAYNNLTGRRYPHTQHSIMQQTHATHDPAPTERIGFTHADLDAVLKSYGQVLDISRDDLEDIIVATEMKAYERRFGIITCADIMSTDAVTLEFSSPLE